MEGEGMAKESFVSILGLNKGQSIDVLATVSDKTTANWHINNTFGNMGYDHLIVKTVNKKGDKFVADVIAKDKAKYLNVELIMNKFDWDTLRAVITEGTLLSFSEMVKTNGIKNEKMIGKLGDVYPIHTTDGEEVEDFATTVVLPETEPIPYTKAMNALRKEVLEYVTGDEVSTDSDGVVDETDDEVVEEPMEEVIDESDEPDELLDVVSEDQEAEEELEEVIEEPKKETKSKARKTSKKPKAQPKEEVVEEQPEETVDEVLEEVAGEVAEDTADEVVAETNDGEDFDFGFEEDEVEIPEENEAEEESKEESSDESSSDDNEDFEFGFDEEEESSSSESSDATDEDFDFGDDEVTPDAEANEDIEDFDAMIEDASDDMVNEDAKADDDEEFDLDAELASL